MIHDWLEGHSAKHDEALELGQFAGLMVALHPLPRVNQYVQFPLSNVLSHHPTGHRHKYKHIYSNKQKTL